MSFNLIFGKDFSFTGSDGKEYTLDKFTLEDYAKFVTWVQYKPYRDALIAELPEKVCNEILEECKLGLVKEEVAKDEFKLFPIHLGSTVVTQCLTSVEGILKLMEIGLKKSYGPLFNIKDILNGEMLDEIADGLLKANGLLKQQLNLDESKEKN